MYRRNKLEPNSLLVFCLPAHWAFLAQQAKNRLRLMEEMSVRHRNYAIPTTAVCVSPAYKLSKQTCKCDNEKIAINPAQSWEFLKARQFHPQSKDLFPSTHFLGNQTKIFSQIAATFGTLAPGLDRCNSHFHACSKGEIYNPRVRSQCALFNMLRPETLFEARTKFTHKTNPKKGLSRFWHFYPRKITPVCGDAAWQCADLIYDSIYILEIERRNGERTAAVG